MLYQLNEPVVATAVGDTSKKEYTFTFQLDSLKLFER